MPAGTHGAWFCPSIRAGGVCHRASQKGRRQREKAGQADGSRWSAEADGDCARRPYRWNSASSEPNGSAGDETMELNTTAFTGAIEHRTSRDRSGAGRNACAAISEKTCRVSSGWRKMDPPRLRGDHSGYWYRKRKVHPREATGVRHLSRSRECATAAGSSW